MPRLNGDGVYLRPAEVTDYAEWYALRNGSRAFLEPWEPLWTDDKVTAGDFRRGVEKQTRRARRDQAYAFLIFRASDDKMIGGCVLGPVRRFGLDSALFGGWIAEPYHGRGYGGRATRAVLHFAFDIIGLHRVEVAPLLTNKRTIRLPICVFG